MNENPLDKLKCEDCNTVGQWDNIMDSLICVSTKCCEKRLNVLQRVQLKHRFNVL